MRLKNLEALIIRLEQAIRDSLLSDNAELSNVNQAKIDGLFSEIRSTVAQERFAKNQILPAIVNLIQQIPMAIAILDHEMNYLAVSQGWINARQLPEVDFIGRNHWEVFPELSARWREDYAKCLTGELQALSPSEDFLVRENGTIDWFRWQLSPWHNLQGEIGGLIIYSEIITERKLLQQKIASTEEQMRAVFAEMKELVFTVELDSEAISILPTRFLEIYDDGVVDQIIAGLQTELFSGSPEDPESLRALNARALATKTTIEFEYSLQLDHSIMWFSVNLSPMGDGSVIWIARDVTHRKQTAAEIQYIEKELAQITLQSLGDGVITTNANGLVQYLNPSAEYLTGWSAKSAKGKQFSSVFCLIDCHTNQPILKPLQQVARYQTVSRLTARNFLLGRNSIRREIEGSVSPIVNRQQKLIGTVTVFRDVTHARKMARRLSWQANHDPLTKLYNRRKFEEYAVQAIAEARLHQAQHALCYLDLDRFKIINDTCGHAAGDRLLRQVASLLRKRIRRADIFARLGGDEFGIIFHQCPIEIALKCANELRQSIEDFRFVWQDKVFRIGVSIGLVEIKPTTLELTNLLNSADAACYVAKQQGGNYVHLCDEQDSVIARQQGERKWIEKINHALEKNHFCLYAQKIVPIEKIFNIDQSLDHAQTHYEILLRLRDEAGNITTPGAFLPAAERYGLMPAIDRWVISNFLAGYEQYCQSNFSSPLDPTSKLFTINLSGASINNQEFGNFLRSQFDRYCVPPQTICFEITETVAITNLEQANILINQLKELGCSIALDDFGSGMSSLTYLKNLPIDYLKIDGSFVTNIANDEIDYATVECFNHISQIMQIKTIAEFVNNQTTLNNLRQIGVDFAQGYGIERPKPLVWR